MTVGFIEEYPGARAAEDLERAAREMLIFAQDLTVKDDKGEPLVAKVRVPADRLADGPHSHRFLIVDYDASTGRLLPPVDLTDPKYEGRDPAWSFNQDLFTGMTAKALENSASFHAQNAYAIAARTLAAFEFALGRRLPWAFPSHELYIVPHAFAEANAYYSPDDHALLFGYVPLEDGTTVYTCCSHDIVAHETTHAILDGLRPRFMKPGLPDQAAFHEAFADIVALLSVFSIPELVESQLGETDEEGLIPAGKVSEREFHNSALFQVAEQIGQAQSGNRGSALRRSLTLKPNVEWKSKPEFEEPHRRGEVLVAAVMRTLAAIWGKRVEDLIRAESLSRSRAAREGAKSAEHLLNMSIRAIDYAPAMEFEFEDFLDAMLVSDAIVAPEDSHDYRGILRDSFGAWGIEQPKEQTISLSETPLRYRNINYVSLRADRDEVFWFIWQNAEALRIDRSFHLLVDSVRPSVRVGPDGLIVNEVVADYAQALDGTAAGLAALGVTIPEGVKSETEIQVWGGGTIIFDQFGMAKLHERKPIDDWEGRQSRRLEYLVRHGFYDTMGRLGFSHGAGEAFRFADFHVPDDLAGEEW
jgi:hypothetical protein